MSAGYQPFLILILPPGAFLVIGFLMALHRKVMMTFYNGKDGGSAQCCRTT
jgi:Na+-translocating ferredoxin:NAD+ oxidoreductase RnfE subunit